jgi:hypothetical protein
MLKAAGAEITEGKPSRVRIALNGRCAVFQRPHPQKENRQGSRSLPATVADRGWSDAIIEYKGYIGKVEFNDEAGIFRHGSKDGISG